MADKENNFSQDPSSLPGSNPEKPGFTPEILDKTIIAIPLLKAMQEEKEVEKKTKDAEIPGQVPPTPKVYDIIIDLNLSFPGGRQKARERVKELIEQLKKEATTQEHVTINEVKTNISTQYVFASLTGDMVRKLVQMDNYKEQIITENKEVKEIRKRSIYRIWPDFDVKPFTTKSISTVKADAARSSFSAFGEGITWAVIDSGIDKDHPHFKLHSNIHDSYHKDFTALTQDAEKPFNDSFGHGTHVAGIIAGEMKSRVVDGQTIDKIKAVVRHRDEQGNIVFEETEADAISGMAPKCKLVSLKALDDEGKGKASNLIVATEYIQEINGYGRDLKINGVNMSLGYDFDPEWFACGQSPLCVEVDRLVKSGVVVVVAAGNTGYGFVQSAFRNVVATGMQLSINDPGNAELAITVGSTHRDMPHTYGVSYFSSKGPTGDGRLKPDLVAPGEKIISCAAGIKRKIAENQMQGQRNCYYVEDSGTSMAAPHVSGVIAAFLSIRKEFIGKPEQVKEIFLSTATDLKRDRYFQGMGLIDLMRAIQSV